MASRNVATEYCGRVVGRVAAAVAGHVPHDRRVVGGQAGTVAGEHVGRRGEPVGEQHRRPRPRDLVMDVHAAICPTPGRRLVLASAPACSEFVGDATAVDVDRRGRPGATRSVGGDGLPRRGRRCRSCRSARRPGPWRRGPSGRAARTARAACRRTPRRTRSPAAAWAARTRSRSARYGLMTRDQRDERRRRPSAGPPRRRGGRSRPGRRPRTRGRR